MQSAIGTDRVSSGALGLAAVLLAGVLAIGYGYFHPSKVAFYAGLVVTAAGVIIGTIRLVVHGSGRDTQV